MFKGLDSSYACPLHMAYWTIPPASYNSALAISLCQPRGSPGVIHASEKSPSRISAAQGPDSMGCRKTE
jgi:hypothetical protein